MTHRHFKRERGSLLSIFVFLERPLLIIILTSGEPGLCENTSATAQSSTGWMGSLPIAPQAPRKRE
jgi:hypothetical protein